MFYRRRDELFNGQALRRLNFLQTSLSEHSAPKPEISFRRQFNRVMAADKVPPGV